MIYVFILLIFLSSCSPNNQDIIDSDKYLDYEARIVSDKNGEILELSNRDKNFILDFSKVSPFSIEFCNIDGGDVEVLIGVNKKTPFDENISPRPFFYNIDFENEKLRPKMRVSRLSNPLEEFNAFDIDNDGIDELISIERDISGKYDINAYKYINTFRFEIYYQSKKLDILPKLGSKDGEIILDGKHNKLYLYGGNILWEEI